MVSPWSEANPWSEATNIRQSGVSDNHITSYYMITATLKIKSHETKKNRKYCDT